MRKLIFGLVLSMSISGMAQNWVKVANEGDTITATSYHIFRLGVGKCWSNNIFMEPTTFLASATNFLTVYKIPDPCPGATKEIDALAETTPYTITTNNLPVIVPAKSSGPPPAIPPSISITLTLNPLPVVLNGTKYNCTSVVMDNTGTLTLTCF
jgi:hypothetical protein